MQFSLSLSPRALAPSIARSTNTPTAMASLNHDLIFLVLQFLDDEKFKETVHKLEEESGLYFNTRYFEELILEGKLDDAEKYLSEFTKMDDNRHSKKIIFEIRKQKFLEALDRNEKTKALDILLNELKVFARGNPELFKEMVAFLTLENFREHEQLSKYEDTNRARQMMLVELKNLIDANPLLREKLQFPNVMAFRLPHLVNQSIVSVTTQGVLPLTLRPFSLTTHVLSPMVLKHPLLPGL